MLSFFTQIWKIINNQCLHITSHRSYFCTTPRIQSPHKQTNIYSRSRVLTLPLNRPRSMPSYSDSSRRSYSHLKPIVHNPTSSRDSSIDSQTSYGSRSSTEGHYSTSSRSSMGHSSAVSVVDVREKKHRVPDNSQKFITTKSRGSVDVTHHDKARFKPDETRSSKNTYLETHSSSSKRNPKYWIMSGFVQGFLATLKVSTLTHRAAVAYNPAQARGW